MSEQNYYGPFSDLSNLISDRYSQDGQFTEDLINAAALRFGYKGVKNIWNSRPYSGYQKKIQGYKDKSAEIDSFQKAKWSGSNSNPLANRELVDRAAAAKRTQEIDRLLTNEKNELLGQAHLKEVALRPSLIPGFAPGGGQVLGSAATLYANNDGIPFMEDTGTWWNPLD